MDRRLTGRRARRAGAMSSAPLPAAAYFGAAGVVVVVTVLIAAVLLVMDRGSGSHAEAPAISVPESGAVPSAYSQAASTAVFAAIAERTADPSPLTAAEVFHPKTIMDADSHAVLKLTVSKLDTQCTAAIWGRRLALALQRAGCTQVSRATYADRNYTALITIFNLADVTGADQVVTTVAPGTGNGFPRPLTAFGPGFSIARGLAMGHYVVIDWVQRRDGTGDEQDRKLLSLLVATGRPRAVLTRVASAGTKG